MADAPDPITSPPAQPWQPYEPQDHGPADASQSRPTQVYDAAGGTGNDPWPKIQDAGAASMETGEITGGWPGNGTSTDPWHQT